MASILRAEKSTSEEPEREVASRLSHQSKTPSYIRTGGGEGEWATWEINRGEGYGQRLATRPGGQVAESRPEQVGKESQGY
jgi:hypothetical protein